MRLRYLIVCGLLIITATVSGQAKKKQTRDNSIATIGKKEIGAVEYKTRYELMPHVSKNSDLVDSLKYEFLYSLVSEKLWALEAEAQGIDTTELMKYSMLSLEKLYVKDALYKQEIESKIKISPDELIKGTFRKGTKLLMNTVASTDSAEIFSIYKDLKNGASFDSILALRDINKEQKEPIPVNFGEMEQEYVEDTLYAMNVGDISHPVLTSNGWFIFTIKQRVSEVFNNDNAGKVSSEAKKIIHDRKAKKLYDEYMRNYFTKVKVTTDGALYRSLTNKAAEILIRKAAEIPATKQASVSLSGADLAKIADNYGPDTLKMNFIRFETKPATMKDYLYNLTTDGFAVKEPTINKVGAKIREDINRYIEQELLSREGYKRGLQNLPEVKNDMALWKENYIANILKNHYVDSAKVSDQEVLDYYNQLNNVATPITQVNIIEVLTPSLEIIEQVLNELKAGKDIRELARKYTSREWTKEKGGEFGLFPVTMYGEIGAKAEKMKIGEVYGPLKVAEGYSVFKLIDKKEKRDSVSESFEQVKAKFKNDLQTKKLNSVFDKVTVRLAQKYGFKINEGELKKMNVTSINMFTSRYMGFGGRIAAVPYTAPDFEWIKQWKKEKKLNP